MIQAPLLGFVASCHCTGKITWGEYAEAGPQCSNDGAVARMDFFRHPVTLYRKDYAEAAQSSNDPGAVARIDFFPSPVTLYRTDYAG